MRHRHEPRAEHEETPLKPAHVPSTALEAARRAAAIPPPHQQAEIEGAGVDEEPFEDVALPAQVRAAHPAGVVDMGERPLQMLAASSQQPLAALAAQTPAIAVDRPLRIGRGDPLTAAPIRFDIKPGLVSR